MSVPPASRSAVISSLNFPTARDSLTIGSGWADVTRSVLAFIKKVGLSGTEILR
jgi:hypothetical protein